MARRRTHRLWLVVLLLAAGIGIAGGVASDEVGLAGGHHPAAAQLTPTAVEEAVVPGRTEAGLGTSTRQAPGRSFLPLVVALVGLAGVLALGSRPGRARTPERRPLAVRRPTLALRGPPSLPLV